MFGAIERLWPLWVLLVTLAAWRLWHLRARGEGDPQSTARERQRWQRTLIAAGALLLLSFAVIVVEGRPQPGAYRPAEMEQDGTMEPAIIEKPAAHE